MSKTSSDSESVNSSDRLDALRQRARKLSTRLQLAQQDMTHQTKNTEKLPLQMIKFNQQPCAISALQHQHQHPQLINNHHAQRVTPIPIALPIGMSQNCAMPTHVYAVPVAQSKQQQQQQQQQLHLQVTTAGAVGKQGWQQPASSTNVHGVQQTVSILSIPRHKPKPKRILLHEVDALMELVEALAVMTPEVNSTAKQLVRSNKLLSELDWPNLNKNTEFAPPSATRVNGQATSNQQCQQQVNNRWRRNSEMSNASNSNDQQSRSVPTKKSNKTKTKEKKDKSNRTNTPRSRNTELIALRAYINKIIQEYIGAEQILPEELQFKGDFAELESHAQLLIKAGYGRIVEDEIRVNRKNNRQAFITMSTNREAMDQDGILLLPVARRYAFDGDIVRAFVLHAGGGATVNKSIEEETAIVVGGNDSLGDDEELSDLNESQESDNDSIAQVVQSDNCPRAFVISIVKQTELREIVGTISFTNSIKLGGELLYYKFRPYDQRVPMVYIPEESCVKHIGNKKAEDVSGLLFLAHILETDCNGHCIADLIQPVGRVGNLEDEVKAILMHNGLRDVVPFEQRFNDLYEGPTPPITEDDLKNRADLRDRCIFTIDPLTARDLDDALSIECINEDEFEVGVHISDVSHYVVENSELDNIVKLRSTSIYLVTEVLHMLPQPLCFRCSLLPGEDKFAFSVFWRISADGQNVGPPRFTRSVIKSCTQFAYEHAQKIIDNPQETFTDNDFPNILNGFTVDDVVKRILWLHRIAVTLRGSRFENGALTINNTKVRFNLDPIKGEPQSFEVEVQQEANRMIEEFMLLANQSVAKFIHQTFPDTAVLRNHPPPLTKSLKALHEKLQPLGINLDYSSSKALQSSITRLCSDAADATALIACLSQLLMKPMARAQYFCSEGKTDPAQLWHYALSIPIYTHFTSPIRRYPDIMVHRLLAAGLNYCPPPERSTDELHELTKIANQRKYNAKLAGEDSSNLYFKRYIANEQGIYMRGVVMEIYTHMMNVVTLESGHVISINFKMQRLVVDNSHAPEQIVILERGSMRPVMKLQLFTVFPIRVVIWDGKLTGFIANQEQIKGEIANKRLTSRRQSMNNTHQPNKNNKNKQHQQQQQQQQQMNTKSNTNLNRSKNTPKQ